MPGRHNLTDNDDESKVPVWIVSFSDMVTLLLAFFVLLQSFAHVRDPDLFFIGQGSFKQAIAGLGIPKWMFGREDKIRREHGKVKHPAEPQEKPSDTPPHRLLDADNEAIQHTFARLRKELDSKARDERRQPVRFEATGVQFAPGSAELDDAARAVLDKLAMEIRDALAGSDASAYVIGLAADAGEPSQQWALSALRARAAEAYLDARLQAAAGGTATPWRSFSWGAGPGGRWCREAGIVPEKTSIAIALLRGSSPDG